MPWTVPAPDEADGPVTGPDRPILEGYLDFQRTTLRNICAGLTAEQLAARPIASSTLSLQGLVRHLTKVERIWLRIRAAGEDVESVFPLGSDVDFDDTDPAHAEQEFAAYLAEVEACRAAAADVDFEHEVTWRAGTWSVRMVYVHMIGEYARHNGHADLLREAIDGVTGR